MEINTSTLKIRKPKKIQNALILLRKHPVQLQQYYLKYQSLYECISDPFRSINTEGIILNCNKSYETLLGYTKNEVIGTSIFSHTAKQSLDAMKNSFETWKKTGHVENREVLFKRKDGTTFPVILDANTEYDYDGNIIGSNTIIKDISEIKKIERKFQTLYENSSDLYRTINTDGIILDCNKSYFEHLGYTKEEVIGKSIFEHVSPSDKKAMRASFETWRNTGHVINRNAIFERKDGSIFPVIVSANNLHDVDGKLIGSNTIIRDMSELHDAEKKIGYEKMKRLSVIGELTARVSHDLLNPLTAIKNSLFLLQSGSERLDKDSITEYERLERAVSRMAIQIEDVLDFVKEKPLALRDSCVSEILKHVMERIKISENVLINLPKNDKQITCDHEKLEIVFINLIMNAMQAMNHEGKIDIRVSDKDNYIIIEIEDSGHGISDDSLTKIFDPLYTTRDIGTGLGLVSCKNIVERHRGTIKVETVVGKGTTFIIKLPKMVKEIVQK